MFKIIGLKERFSGSLKDLTAASENLTLLNCCVAAYQTCWQDLSMKVSYLTKLISDILRPRNGSNKNKESFGDN